MNFPHTKVLVTKLSDATLDSIITSFLIPKITALLKPKHKQDYEGWDYRSRCINDWFTVGAIHWFLVTPKTPSNLKTVFDIESLKTSDILNWMCAEGIVDSGQYLVEVVQII